MAAPKKLSLDEVNQNAVSAPKKLSLEQVASVSAPERIKNTNLESALKGAVQAASFGFEDEGEGAVRTLWDKLKDSDSDSDLEDLYLKHRDNRRASNELARRDNPTAYTVGELGGSIASSFIPGFGLAKAAQVPGLVGKLIHAGKAGAAIGAGTSDADLTKGDVGNFTEDVISGGLVGAATQGLLSTAGAVKNALKPTVVAKKAANVLLNTPDEITEIYMQNPSAVKNAKLRYEVARDFDENALSKLKTNVTEGSAGSRAILANEGKKLNSTQLADVYDREAQKILDRSEGVLNDPEAVASYKWLKHNSEQLRRGAHPEVDVGPQYTGGTDLSTNRIKDEIQSIDRAVDFDIGNGRFGRVGEQPKKQVRGELDTILKSESPAYAEQMKQVASDAELLKDATGLANSPEGFANLFRRVETDKYGAGQIPRDTLSKVDERLGTDYLDQIKYSNAREAFDKSVTQGSMNVNKFSNWLKDVPGLKYAAPLIGASVDKYGREMTIKAVDAAADLSRAMQKEGPQAVQRLVAPLIAAAQKGNTAAMLTYQIFSESNPQSLIDVQQRNKADQLSSIYGENAVKNAEQSGIDINKLADTQFIKPLMQAAQKSPKDVAVMHFLMSQKDPAYQQTMNGNKK